MQENALNKLLDSTPELWKGRRANIGKAHCLPVMHGWIAACREKAGRWGP